MASANVARIAILDDYQNVSLQMADWSPLAGRAVITVFNDHLTKPADPEMLQKLLALIPKRSEHLHGQQEGGAS